MTAVQTKTRSGSETRKKRHRVGFRASDSEYAEIEEAAKHVGLSPGLYARSRCLPAAPITRAHRRPVVEVQAITRLQGEMNKVGSNIHQILRRVNFGDTPTGDEIRAAFTGYREVIAAIMATLNRVPR